LHKNAQPQIRKIRTKMHKNPNPAAAPNPKSAATTPAPAAAAINTNAAAWENPKPLLPEVLDELSPSHKLYTSNDVVDGTFALPSKLREKA
jgi:hypothetical protein